MYGEVEAKKAREVQLEQRRRELEEKRQRLRDHKEQEALEKQIKQLEVLNPKEAIRRKRQKNENSREKQCKDLFHQNSLHTNFIHLTIQPRNEFFKIAACEI